MTVSIEYEAEKKLDLPYEKIIKEIVEASLDFEKCPYEAEVNVILTDNDAIQAINKEYRQIDAPTDVLSFPMVDYEKPSDFDHVEDAVEDYFNPETGELMLGDIVISVDKVEEQAEKYGHSQRRNMMLGTILCIAALCAGCGKKASEEAAQTQVPTTQETTTQAATSAPKILIQSDEEQK